MIDSNARSFFQNWLIKPITNIPFIYNCSPICLTLLGLLFGISCGLLIAIHYFYLAIIALLLSGLFDALDGSIARKRNMVSPKGCALDICSDRVVESAIIFGLYLCHQQAAACIWMLISILLCITTFLVVGILSNQESEKSFYYSPGIMERSEAFAFFFLMIVLPDYFLLLSYIFSALVLLTAGIRLKQFCKKHS